MAYSHMNAILPPNLDCNEISSTTLLSESLRPAKPTEILHIIQTFIPTIHPTSSLRLRLQPIPKLAKRLTPRSVPQLAVFVEDGERELG